MEMLKEERVLNALKYGYFDSYFKEAVFGNSEGVLSHRDWRKNRANALELLELAIEVLMVDKLRDELPTHVNLIVGVSALKELKAFKFSQSQALRYQTWSIEEFTDWERLGMNIRFERTEFEEMILTGDWSDIINSIVDGFVEFVKGEVKAHKSITDVVLDSSACIHESDD